MAMQTPLMVNYGLLKKQNMMVVFKKPQTAFVAFGVDTP